MGSVLLITVFCKRRHNTCLFPKPSKRNSNADNIVSFTSYPSSKYIFRFKRIWVTLIVHFFDCWMGLVNREFWKESSSLRPQHFLPNFRTVMKLWSEFLWLHSECLSTLCSFARNNFREELHLTKAKQNFSFRSLAKLYFSLLEQTLSQLCWVNSNIKLTKYDWNHQNSTNFENENCNW
jgi:hypothetical protein